jgi:hypothetical protein
MKKLSWILGFIFISFVLTGATLKIKKVGESDKYINTLEENAKDLVVDGVLDVNSSIKSDSITEKTTDNGVTIEGVTLKDGSLYIQKNIVTVTSAGGQVNFLTLPQQYGMYLLSAWVYGGTGTTGHHVVAFLNTRGNSSFTNTHIISSSILTLVENDDLTWGFTTTADSSSVGWSILRLY